MPVDVDKPATRAVFVMLAMVAVSVVAALLDAKGAGFAPRVDAIDALAGLTIGAFVVDRLLTFVPPIGAAREVKQRTLDLTVLRVGYGALIGAAFVMVTNLQAVQALTGENADVGDGLDRVIAVLAIAGGVAGLARLWSAVNPQPDTDGAEERGDDAATGDNLPRPTITARVVGLALVAGGALYALRAVGDARGVELLGPGAPADDGTIAIVLRFGLVLVAAAIVQQLVQAADRFVPKHNKPVVLGGLAVLLGVVAARAFDLYLMHNVGFFGVTGEMRIDGKALASSTDLELWADTFLTGVVIAAGTKPLHDIAARLRKSASA